MFIENKYSKWYFTLVEFRKNNAPVGYSERHHIIPKSLGGSNKKDNMVSLSAREHFICHRLLVKMTCGKAKMKMSYALRILIHAENKSQTRYKITSKIYEHIKSEIRTQISQHTTGKNNSFYGKKHKQETKNLLSSLRKERHRKGISEGMTGKNHSEETKEKLRLANKKQFEDPYQIELRKTKCNKIQGMKIYHNKEGKTKYFVEGSQPSGWEKGRVLKMKGGSSDE